jgi:hypothetical protein
MRQMTPTIATVVPAKSFELGALRHRVASNLRESLGCRNEGAIRHSFADLCCSWSICFLVPSVRRLSAQLRCTRQLPPEARSSAHNLSALSRLVAPNLTLYQLAAVPRGVRSTIGW